MCTCVRAYVRVCVGSGLARVYLGTYSAVAVFSIQLYIYIYIYIYVCVCLGSASSSS